MAQIEVNDNGMFYGASPKLHEFAKELRARETPYEKLVWEQLNKKQLAGFKFRRQHPIFYFVADFYCHKAKLIVEVDGGIHRVPEQFEYDINRDYELKLLGLSVLRFTNDQVVNELDIVVSQIKAFIKIIPITAK